ncbi:MAG: hypothetical protein JRH20_22150 [Deltaproteobacteria bacterium]|nr:hypothetical protein [Deltaproteobacteria bacterium]
MRQINLSKAAVLPLAALLCAHLPACSRTSSPPQGDSTLIDSASVDSAPVDSGPVDSAPVDSAPVDSAPVDSTCGRIVATIIAAEDDGQIGVGHLPDGENGFILVAGFWNGPRSTTPRSASLGSPRRTGKPLNMPWSSGPKTPPLHDRSSTPVRLP